MGGGVFLALVLSTVAGLALFIWLGRPMVAPQWLTARIEARADAALGDTQLRFDRLRLVLRNGWQPHVQLSNVQLLTPDGSEIVSFSEVETRFATRPMLRGQLLPRTIGITGVFATLKRDADGRLQLSGGTGFGGPVREAANLTQMLGGLDAVLSQAALQELRRVRVNALTLRFEDAISARAWTVDGGRMRLERAGDRYELSADLALLSGGQGVATLAANYVGEIGSPEVEAGLNFEDVAARDVATLNPALEWLSALRAPISGALRSGVDADGSLRPLAATLSIGAGAVQPIDATRPVYFRGARTYFTFDPARRLFDFNEVSVDSEWITARAEGRAWFGAGAGPGEPGDLVGQFEFGEMSFNPANLYLAPVMLEGARMDFRLRLDPFRVEFGEFLLRDQGHTARASGDLTATPEGWRYALDAQLDAMAPDRLIKLWPERLMPRSRTWVAENVSSGHLDQIDFALRGQPDAPPDTYLSFDFRDLTARVVRTLPPVTGGNGHVTLLRDRFVVSLDAGRMLPPDGGEVTFEGTQFIIPDVKARPAAPAVVRVVSDSSVTAVLSLLDQPPLSLLQKANRPVDLVEGRARLEGTIAMPLKKGNTLADIDFDIAGTVSNVSSVIVVPGFDMAADQLQVVASEEGVAISGPGTLQGVPFDGAWTLPIGAQTSGSSVVGSIELTPEALQAFRIALPPGMVSGRGTGQVSVSLPRGAPPRLELASDLAGVALSVPELGWVKPAGTTGSLVTEVVFRPQPEVEVLRLEASGLDAEGSVTLRPEGGLDRIRFDRVALGGWLNAPVTLEGRGAGLSPAIRVEGGSLDLRRATFGGGSAVPPQGGARTPLSLVLDRLQVTDTIAMTDMRGDFTTTGGLDGTFTARVNGGPQVSGRVLPQNGRSAVRITAEDAGRVISSAGLMKQARGGEMSLVLLPVGQAGAFDGTLEIRNTRVKNAPVMADLLSALSIVGLLEQLSGNGIVFSEVEASFRLTPDQVVLSQASAVGPSMGISMDGIYRTADKALDMQGVISPVYLINGIGSVLTRKGEGLFGFSYRLRGRADDPSVQVNPLSALTPGMFREVFRAPAPTVPEADVQVPEAFVPERAPEPVQPPGTLAGDR